MIKNRVGLSLVAGLGVMLMACGSDSSGTAGSGGSGGSGACENGEVECGEDCIPEADGSLAWVQANVFDVNGCALSSCHAGSNPSMLEDLDLTDEAASFNSLVDVMSSQADRLLVVPADVGSSYLVNKLTGEGMAPTTNLMPTGATTPICDAKIDGVRAWINSGALP